MAPTGAASIRTAVFASFGVPVGDHWTGSDQSALDPVSQVEVDVAMRNRVPRKAGPFCRRW
jgi:hypothetical protein